MAATRINAMHGSPKSLHQASSEAGKIHRPASLVAPHMMMSSPLTSQTGGKRHSRGHSLGQIGSPLGTTTVEPRYYEVLGTMKITLLYQVSHYIRVKKTKKYKELGPAKLPCYKRVLLYIRPLYNEVPLYKHLLDIVNYQGDL